MTLMLRTACMLALSPLVLGCEDDLPKATDITAMRILGARTEVVGDPTRSTPAPGETATMSFAVAFPSVEVSDAELSSLFITCTAPARYTGIPTCQEFIDALSDPEQDITDAIDGASAADLSCEGNEGMAAVFGTIGVACVSGAPKLDVEIEDETEVAAKLVLGVICRNGTPTLDPEADVPFSCRKGSGVADEDFESIALYGTVPIQYDADDANENPDPADLTLTFEGKAWPAAPAGADLGGDEDCKDAIEDGTVLRADGLDTKIGLAWNADAREERDGELETIEISAYVTTPEIERRFTVFAPDFPVTKGELREELTWKMSTSDLRAVARDSKLVRFYFTVMDRFGGFTVVSRAVCVRR